MDGYIRFHSHVSELMNTHGNVEEVDLHLFIRGQDVTVKLTIGMLELNGVKLETRLVLKADYPELHGDYVGSLSSESSESFLDWEYAAAMQIAVHKLCAERHWIIDDEVSHAPVLHFMVGAWDFDPIIKGVLLDGKPVRMSDAKKLCPKSPNDNPHDHMTDAEIDAEMMADHDGIDRAQGRRV